MILIPKNIEIQRKMINNKDMKNTFLILSLLILFCSPVLAVPDTIQKGRPTVTYWENSYNIQLRQKLESDYQKKYPPVVTKTKDCTTYAYYNRPLGSYGKEVIGPYERSKQQEYKIIKRVKL